MSFLSINLTTKALIRALQWRKMEKENHPTDPPEIEKDSAQGISQ